eukprot:1995288-Ditylum_brightwellii.AAC.1
MALEESGDDGIDAVCVSFVGVDEKGFGDNTQRFSVVPFNLFLKEPVFQLDALNDLCLKIFLCVVDDASP